MCDFGFGNSKDPAGGWRVREATTVELKPKSSDDSKTSCQLYIEGMEWYLANPINSMSERALKSITQIRKQIWRDNVSE